MRSLIVGGTSGLGLEMAKLLQVAGDEVIITGRRNPGVEHIQFHKFDLATGAELARTVEEFVSTLPQIDRLVYAAGFYQEGHIDELEPEAISHMLDVGIHAPIWFVRSLIRHQKQLPQFVAITSTSQWTPREKEPVYDTAKAGLGMLANALSLDARVGKVLVVGPAGMNTAFWRATEKDVSKYNDPVWVAKQVVEALEVDFKYAFVRVMRDPARTEIAELR